jgi:GNAT superfamily N-acetyltransferase
MNAVAAAAPDPLSADLNESDSLYFELGAEVRNLPGCMLVHMPGLFSVPAACVVQRVKPVIVLRNPQGWLDQVETELSRLGVVLSRIYLMQRCGLLENVLRAAGYQCRDENGYVLPAGQLGRNDVMLRPIQSEDDWARKRWVHEQVSRGADGYETTPKQWMELVRRKAETGQKKCFLIERHGQLCGTVAAIDMPLLVRAKNLVVLPDFRRAGIGTAVLDLLSFRALQLGKHAVGAFGICDDAGDALYRKAGFRQVSLIMEWSRGLIQK